MADIFSEKAELAKNALMGPDTLLGKVVWFKPMPQLLLDELGVEILEKTQEEVVGYEGWGIWIKPILKTKREKFLVRGDESRRQEENISRENLIGHVFYQAEVCEGEEGFGVYLAMAWEMWIGQSRKGEIGIRFDISNDVGQRIAEDSGISVGKRVLPLVRVQWGRDVMVVLPEEVEEISQRGCVVLNK